MITFKIPRSVVFASRPRQSQNFGNQGQDQDFHFQDQVLYQDLNKLDTRGQEHHEKDYGTGIHERRKKMKTSIQYTTVM